jgi:hypothetical protein
MMSRFVYPLILATLLLVPCSTTGCKKQEKPSDDPEEEVVKVQKPTDRNDDEGLLTYYQYLHFQYMWSGGCPNSGLARVRYWRDNPSKDADIITVGASGFGLMGIIVAVERHFITRDDALKRFEKVLDFLERADRWHGMFPHWYYDSTAKTKPFGGKEDDNGADVHESANLIQGLLCVRQYMDKTVAREKAIAERIDALWQAMEWDWFVDENGAILWHWSPTVGFQKHLEMTGFNETHIVYILACSSPTHPVAPEVYKTGWGKNGDIVNDATRYDIPINVRQHKGTYEVGPMYWTAFSYAGFCPKGIKDPYGIDYFEALKSHALIQYTYCSQDNPNKFSCYSEDCWGMSSGYTTNNSSDYQAMCTKNDVGVITADAAIIAMPYTPEKSLAVARHFYWDVPTQMGPWGLWDSYSDTEGTVYKYLGNNQCIVVPMIENYRTGLLWDLFMSCPEIQEGLDKIGFTKN